MKKVLFLTTYASPYRVAFFDELGKTMDVTVLYSDSIEKQSHRNREWFVSGDGNARGVQLQKCVKAGSKQEVCLDVLSWLKMTWDEIVICGYSNPTSMLAMAYLKVRKIPFWLEVDGGLIRQDSKLKYLFKKTLVSSASGWLSTGKSTTKYLCHYGADPERTKEYPFTSQREEEILAEPVLPEEKLALRQELGLTGKKVLLSIGQFIHRKGFDVLIKAAAQMDPDAQIYILGGEPTQEYVQMVQELGIRNIHFEGFQKKDRLIKYYRAADVFVLPTREDIWGLVVNEAMAYGLPVITTDRCVAGLDLVENGVNGYVVPVEDVQALADAMSRILGEDLQAMGWASLEKIRPYTLENMAKVHKEIFEKGR